MDTRLFQVGSGMRHVAGAALTCAALLGGGASAQPAQAPLAAQPAVGVSKQAPLGPARGPHLTGAKVSLPLLLVHGFPFVEGRINDTAGKLMFDLGDPSGLTVDIHTVPLADGAVVGRGFFGSGQRFTRKQFPVIKTLLLSNGLSFSGMTSIYGQPGLPIEQHLAPDFIGWLGVSFFDGYVLKLSYDGPTATFYRDDMMGSGVRAAIAGERVRQSVRLGNRDHRNLLTVPVTVGGEAMSATLDTGTHTTAWLNEARIEAWKRAGFLHGKEGRFTISGLQLDGAALPEMAVEITRGPPPFRKLLPGEPEVLIALGYEFWKLHPTVLDYERGVLRVLES